MSWKQIENSYFWLNYSLQWRTLTLRFLHPLGSKVREFKFKFAYGTYDLVGEDTEDEIKFRRRQNERRAKEEKQRKEKQEWEKTYNKAVQEASKRIGAQHSGE